MSQVCFGLRWPARRAPHPELRVAEKEKPVPNILAIRAGTVYTPTEEIRDGVILIDGGRIAKVGPARKIKVPAKARRIAYREGIAVPGFIDLHIHGGGGRDMMEATPEAVSAVALHLARHGTTSFLATTVTASLEWTLQATRGLGQIIRDWNKLRAGSRVHRGAQPLGIHFEGPFLSVERRGVHPAAHILKPSTQVLQLLLEAAGGAARVLTIAPELDAGLAVLKYARKYGVRVGIGHSNAVYEEAERAIDAGATHAVHIFNAMRPFSHRDPGILGAALTDDRLSAELICDGVHVEPPAVRLLMKSKGLERIILITDSLSCCGCADGSYPLGEMTVQIAGGACRTPEGTLAGSILTLDAALRNFSEFTGLAFQHCLVCATANPARILGLARKKGILAPGADADLVLLDRALRVTQVLVQGRPIFE